MNERTRKPRRKKRQEKKVRGANEVVLGGKGGGLRGVMAVVLESTRSGFVEVMECVVLKKYPT